MSENIFSEKILFTQELPGFLGFFFLLIKWCRSIIIVLWRKIVFLVTQFSRSSVFKDSWCRCSGRGTISFRTQISGALFACCAVVLRRTQMRNWMKIITFSILNTFNTLSLCLFLCSCELLSLKNALTNKVHVNSMGNLDSIPAHKYTCWEHIFSCALSMTLLEIAHAILRTRSSQAAVPPNWRCQEGVVVSSFDRQEAEILGKLVLLNYYLGYN